jgi:hypothetical protein
MIPSAGASGQPIGLADAFDVPVFVRHSSPLVPATRPRQGRVDGASRPWPGIGPVPQAGAYLVPTTWRDVLDAALTVGRDPLPWLAVMPGLAAAEIIARRAPLAAYLHRTASAKTHSKGAGFQLEPNAVYRDGTEKTARAMFGYRIGMTMAEWACRSLMGLGPTIHAEATWPPGYGPMWAPENSQPDLVGYHWQYPETWLIEAKGYRRLGKAHLWKGARQLSAHGLMNGPHTRVLCGTSIEHRVFMTIDIEAVSDDAPDGEGPESGGRPSPDDNDEELVALASSRMLNYYMLQGLPRAALTVRPVGSAVSDRGQYGGTGLVLPLELDQTTREERAIAQDQEAYAHRPPPSRFDMLACRVPGTDLLIGMSRRLFAACRRLDQERAVILRTLEPGIAIVLYRGRDLLDEDAYEEQVQARRARFAETEDATRDRIRAAAREGYEAGQQSGWEQLLDVQPPLVTDYPSGLLESATADTYIAIDTRTPPPGAQLS